MPENFTPLAEWKLTEGYISAIMRGIGGDHMARGSENAQVTGTGLTRASRGPLLVAGKTGSRIFFNTDQSYAGLGTAALNGSGSVFNVKSLLTYIGTGQLNFAGAAIPAVLASSTLSFIKKVGGVYAPGAATGPFQAGHAQPSPPTIFANDTPAAGHTQMSGAVVVYIWRISSIDGQVSLASYASNILVLSGQDVIVQMPAADANAQDIWGIGVVKIGFEEFGVGYQLPTSIGGEVLEANLTTINGITRATEISWSNGDLGADLIPDRAFPPPAGDFAGVMMDTVWLDSAGIIYIGDPGFIGSFPPKNAAFAPEAAVAYLAAGEGVTVRFGTTRIGVLYYVSGSPAIEYRTVIENQGILYPQNAFLGYQGRVCAWLGRPTVLQLSGTNFEADFEYSNRVAEFDTWASQQTAAKPVVGFYDGLGQYECWCLGKQIFARHAPTGKWNAPEDVTGKVSGDIVAGVPVNLPGVGHAGYFSCLNGAGALTLYQYDAGTGSVMKVQTSEFSRMNYGGDVTMIMSEGRADNTNHPVRIQLVSDYDDGNPIADPLEGEPEQTPTDTGSQSFTLREPNAIDAAGKHAVLMTMTSEGGDCGINRVATYGSTEEVETR